MRAILVTGNPGSGKSTVAKELASRGFRAIDPDYDRELSYWLDESGKTVRLEEGPAAPDEAWLRSHRWVWNRLRLEELLAAHHGPTFVCGIALNLEEVLDLFDAVFLLRIDAETQEDRLAAHDLDHPPGRNEAGRQQVRAGRLVFEAQLVAMGAIPIEGNGTPAAVVDNILSRVSGTT